MEEQEFRAEGKQAIRFHVTAERMAEVELGELLDLQDAPNDVRRVTAFMVRFVADADGNFLEGQAATAAVRKVTIGQLKSAFEQVTGDMVETAVPNG